MAIAEVEPKSSRLEVKSTGSTSAPQFYRSESSLSRNSSSLSRAESSRGNTNLLVTSQKQLEIQHCLKSWNCSQLDLGVTLISGDIQIYVRHMLAEDESLRHWGDKEKKLIENTLMKGANGM